ncbi:MAG: hypothetical protein AAFV29_12780, partial [Myxococcota bacterium]
MEAERLSDLQTQIVDRVEECGRELTTNPAPTCAALQMLIDSETPNLPAPPRRWDVYERREAQSFEGRAPR